jgi:site-specific recombinase XerD
MRMTRTRYRGYLAGAAYAGLYTPYSGRPRPCDCRRDRVIRLETATIDWRRLWQIVSDTLSRHGYAEQTIQTYRWVLRGFYSFCRRCPSQTTASLVRGYIDRLVAEHMSWSWVGMNISVLRSVFDKLGGLSVTRGLQTPKRPLTLPEILSRGEVRELLAACRTTRDQLLLGLLYGCGLKVGECRNLKWRDVQTVAPALPWRGVAQKGEVRDGSRLRPGGGQEDYALNGYALQAKHSQQYRKPLHESAKGLLRVRYARGTRQRFLEIPPDLLPVLNLGVERCAPDDFIFQGRRAGTALSVRAIELIVRRAREEAGIVKPISAMTLRHSFAVHCLENGENIRAVQEALGHKSVETTQRYERCIVPPGVVSPIDRLKQAQREQDASHTPHSSRRSAAKTDPVSHVPHCPAPGIQPPVSVPSFGIQHSPISIEHLDLPFRQDTAPSSRSCAAAFYRMLKTHIFGRFLGLRRSSTRAGP